MRKIHLILIVLIIILGIIAINISKNKGQSAITQSKEQIIGTLEVKNGDQLERDIIPRLAASYNLAPEEVKGILASCNSKLMASGLDDFRKMEGLIPVGDHQLIKKDLKEQLAVFIQLSESRYDKISSVITDKNSLAPVEGVILASVIQAEGLKGEYYQEIASVFLNRLSKGGLLQSCVTAEYALGYQRPYLTFDDTLLESPYNTYYTTGLPTGPICSFSEESLKVALSPSIDPALTYFYFDYITGKMSFYADYETFNQEGLLTMEHFEAESPVGKFEKINKQELYGK